jgi:hypothetical protein
LSWKLAARSHTIGRITFALGRRFYMSFSDKAENRSLQTAEAGSRGWANPFAAAKDELCARESPDRASLSMVVRRDTPGQESRDFVVGLARSIIASAAEHLKYFPSSAIR